MSRRLRFREVDDEVPDSPIIPFEGIGRFCISGLRRFPAWHFSAEMPWRLPRILTGVKAASRDKTMSRVARLGKLID